jgi:non-ribosomal peptide synthetase component E (peptide arylation enzyme)
MVVAFVVASDGFDFAAMTEHLTAAGFARQKFPERLERVDALPMNAVGKVQKPALRDLALTLKVGH